MLHCVKCRLFCTGKEMFDRKKFLMYADTLTTDKERVMNNVKKPHCHAELIKQWADGAQIQKLNNDFGFVNGGPEWVDCGSLLWDDYSQYRVKPEPDYPKSTLHYGLLCNVVNDAATYKYQSGTGEGVQTIGARMAADAAVKEFITSGEMVKYFMNPTNGYVNKDNT